MLMRWLRVPRSPVANPVKTWGRLQNISLYWNENLSIKERRTLKSSVCAYCNRVGSESQRTSPQAGVGGDGKGNWGTMDFSWFSAKIWLKIKEREGEGSGERRVPELVFSFLCWETQSVMISVVLGISPRMTMFWKGLSFFLTFV